MKHSGWAAAAALVVSVSGADAQPRGSEVVARNAARSAALVLDCRTPRGLTMRIEFGQSLSGWQANQPVAVRIGDASFPMQLSGGASYVILTNAEALTVTPAVLAALKAGASARLEGAAAARMPQNSRTFPLAGLSGQIEQLERACGLAVAPADVRAAGQAGGQAAPASAQNEAALRTRVMQFLDRDLRDAKQGNGRDANVSIRFTDLNGDGTPEALIVMEHSYWCGSRGCAARVLDLSRPAIRQVGDFIAHSLDVLPGTTAGWRDLSIGGRRVVYRNGQYGR